MNIKELLNTTGKFLKANSPEIFTGLGVSGVVTTSYLVARASFKAERILLAESVKDMDMMKDLPEPKEIPIKEQVKLVWKEYIPAAISGSLTVGCIILASKNHSKRTAAAFTAYSLTERAFSEYREKVVEQIGKGKEEKIRTEIAQESVTKNPPKGTVIIGGGHILCCELWTGRYFRSDMETLRKAENDLNALINNELYVSLSEFYGLVGLPETSNSDNFGWTSDKLMELTFSTVLGEGGEPCLAFDYNYIKPLR